MTPRVSETTAPVAPCIDGESTMRLALVTAPDK